MKRRLSGIRRATREYADEEIAEVLEPEVARWFLGTFGAFTPPQRYAVREIHDGENALISSPTGSGKTLSAFLAILNELVALGKRGALEDRVYCIYVSPLKALNNDVKRNLEEPLAGIRAAFTEGTEAPDIRVGVRTGDTSTNERAKMTRKPPHILITTPESLAIMLSAPKMGQHLAGARYVIVDEVHALAEDKRGVHLALSLERLSERATAAGRPDPVRIGLSATIHPLERIAHYLVGQDRDCLVVDVNYLKFTDLEVISPVPDLVNARWHELQDALYQELDRLIASHRTTLIFTNTRSGTERVVLHLKERFGNKYAELGDAAPHASGERASRIAERFGAMPPDPDEVSRDPEFEEPLPPQDSGTTADKPSFVAAHHGSMSRETRVEVEERLKRGDLKAVVCSTSLELGIDIGYVDLVVMLGSPKGIAKALQRVGRSGHKLHETSKGRIIALDRDDLVEAAVIVKKAREKRMDAVDVPENCLDVLAQHLLGMAIDRVWHRDDALRLVRRAYPYRDLPEEDFDRVLQYLAGKYKGLEERRVYGKIWFDADSLEFGRRGKMARSIYSMNVGTIPDTTRVRISHGERWVGEVEEDFVENLLPGDVFVLGGNTWSFQYARGMKVQVAPAQGRQPTVPAWYSEQLPLSPDLAREVRAFRAEMRHLFEADESPESIKTFLRKEYYVNDVTSEAIFRFFRDQHRYAGIPDADEVLVEEFVNDDLLRCYVFHNVAGRRANEALARAFARRLNQARGVNVRVQVADNGFVLAVPRSVVLPVNDVKGLFYGDLRDSLQKSLNNSEILKRRFRHVATRSLLILRNYAGRSQTVGRQQVNAFVLFHVLRRMDPDFPVIKETYREIYEEAFDFAAAEDLGFRVVSRQATVNFLRKRRAPSPFAFNLVATASGDTVMMEDKRALVRDLHERVMDLLAEEDAA